MRTLLAAVLLAAAPARAQLVTPGAAAAPALPPAAFGAVFGRSLGSTLDSISLRGTAGLLPALQSLRELAVKPTASVSGRAAAVFLLATLAQDPKALPARLAATDIPKPAARRLVQVAERMAQAAKDDPAFAKVLSQPAPVLSGRVVTGAGRETAGRGSAFAERLNAAVEGFLRATGARDGAEAAAELPGTSDAVTEAPPAPRPSQLAPGRPTLAYGDAQLPAIAFPSEGTVISDLWRQAHAVSNSAWVVSYNFDDMDIARDIVAKSQRGEKQVLVGDYSNWFPQGGAEGARKGGQRTQAMEYVLQNLGPNLELYILKGLGSIGIEHNKFTVFMGPAGELLQSGSFNYTKTSQNSHWENVVFTGDAGRVKLYKAYFEWLQRRARPFEEGMAPENPVLDPSDPIPTDPEPSVMFRGVPFPFASFSPNGGTEAWLAKAESLVKQMLDILMFSPFPTPPLVENIAALLDAGLPVRLLADAGELKAASKVLLPLVDKGLQLRIIHGPDMVLHGAPWSEASKMHEKVMLFDGGTGEGLGKFGDSLNISRNALQHNFENTQFWTGALVAVMQAHFDYIWSLAETPARQLLAEEAAKADAAAGA